MDFKAGVSTPMEEATSTTEILMEHLVPSEGKYVTIIGDNGPLILNAQDGIGITANSKRARVS